MGMADEIKFGKHKGRTWNDLSKSEAGISYMQWYVNQPCANPKYAKSDAIFKQELRAFLEDNGHKDNPEGHGKRPEGQSVSINAMLKMATELGVLSKKVDAIYNAVVTNKQHTTDNPDEITWEE